MALALTWGMLVPSVLVSRSREPMRIGEAVTSWEYARTQFGVVVHYLRLSFWPADLCLDYQWPVAQSAGEIVPPAAFLGVLLGVVLWALAAAEMGLPGGLVLPCDRSQFECHSDSGFGLRASHVPSAGGVDCGRGAGRLHGRLDADPAETLAGGHGAVVEGVPGRRNRSRSGNPGLSAERGLPERTADVARHGRQSSAQLPRPEQPRP